MTPDPDLTCCFARTLRALGKDEPLYEYDLRVTYHEPDETELSVSWVGDKQEVPEWMADIHATYEVQPRWDRHYKSTRIKGRVQGLSWFEAPEIAQLAQTYLQTRYR